MNMCDQGPVAPGARAARQGGAALHCWIPINVFRLIPARVMGPRTTLMQDVMAAVASA